MQAQNRSEPSVVFMEAASVLQDEVLQRARLALKERPATVTSVVSPRSAGNKHDFYSEGDYWWPDPDHPEGPYIRKDGMTNPDNFVAHRELVTHFSQQIGILASAWRLTGESVYLDKAMEHCKAWFVDTATRMTPSLLYAQAIKGRVTGRGIGIIDAIQLMEVAQGLYVMQEDPAMDQEVLGKIKSWFHQYLEWVTTHPYGVEERDEKNNHATCWAMQVACFARFVGDTPLMNFCRDRYKNVLLPNQMAENGSFPQEMARTKPYGYALFNLDAMATICQILSTPEDDLWQYTAGEGKSMHKGLEFMLPYVLDKSSWPLKPDVMYWEDWPVATPAFIFAASRFKDQKWLDAWKPFEHFPKVAEVIRNLPVRNPLIWL